MEYLIIALIIAKFCERGAIDIVSMATGRQPPSATYRAAKATSPSEDGPLVRTIKSWWADAMEDVDEARRIRRMDTKEKRDQARADRKAERQRVLDEIEEAKTKARKTEEKRKKGPAPDEVPTEELPEVEEYAPDGEGSRQSEEPPQDRPEHTGGPDRTEGPESATEDTVADIPPITDETEKPTYTPDDREVPEAVDPWFPVETAENTEWRPMFPPEGEGAKIIPMFKEKTEELEPADAAVLNGKVVTADAMTFDENGPAVLDLKGTEQMTTNSAPEGGLGQHQRWTVSMSDWERKAIPQVEMVGAAMRAGKVGPEYLAVVAEIQDLHRIQAEKYAFLYKKLLTMNEIKEKYQANPDAGDKDYVKSE